jgi:redox-regulated HSP33 family molecular chaperone
MLGAEDLDALAEEQEETTVACNYCGRRYPLEAQALHSLAERLRSERS